MIKLRRGAFETNSSSMHCLILTGGRTYTPPDYEDVADKNLISGKLIVRFSLADIDYSAYSTGRFLTSWRDRLSYAIANEASHWGDKYDRKEFTDAIEAEAKKHGLTISIRFPRNMEPYGFYINHQSVGTLNTFLSDTGMTLPEFVFNDDVVVATESDGASYKMIIEEVHRLGYPDVKSITSFESTKSADDLLEDDWS